MENENKVLSEQNADLATQCEQLANSLPEAELTEEDARAAEEIQLLQEENLKQNNRIQAFVRVMQNKGIYDEVTTDEVEYQENLFAHLNAVVDKLTAEFQNLQVIKSGRQSVIIRPDQKISEDNIGKMLNGLKSFLVEQKPLSPEIIRTNGKVINNKKTLQEGANLGFFDPNDVPGRAPQAPESDFPNLPTPKPLEPYRSIVVAPDFPPSPFATNEQTSNSDDPNDLPFMPLPKIEDPVTEPFPVDPITALPFPENENNVENSVEHTQVFRVTDLLKEKK